MRIDLAEQWYYVSACGDEGHDGYGAIVGP